MTVRNRTPDEAPYATRARRPLAYALATLVLAGCGIGPTAEDNAKRVSAACGADAARRFIETYHGEQGGWLRRRADEWAVQCARGPR